MGRSGFFVFPFSSGSNPKYSKHSLLFLAYKLASAVLLLPYSCNWNNTWCEWITRASMRFCAFQYDRWCNSYDVILHILTSDTGYRGFEELLSFETILSITVNIIIPWNTIYSSVHLSDPNPLTVCTCVSSLVVHALSGKFYKVNRKDWSPLDQRGRVVYTFPCGDSQKGTSAGWEYH